MAYDFTIPSLVAELSVYLVFFLACCNALGQGRRWLCTVIGGAAGGFFAEILITRLPEPRYHYTTELFLLHWGGVPLLIGFGWGMIFYAATWTAQRLSLGLVSSSLVAGTLGVNLDLSLDPMAHKHRFWVWEQRTGPFPNADLFGVPFDNFVAWVALIGIYGLSVRGAFHLVDAHARRRARERSAVAKATAAESTTPSAPRETVPGVASLEADGKLWLDVLVPPLAALGAGAVFGLVRNRADQVYAWVGNTNASVGEALVFSTLFALGTLAFLLHVRAAGRHEEPNWVVIGIAGYIHALSAFLFLWEVFADRVNDTAAMGFMIPMNLMAGLLAFAWPSLDTLLARYAKQSPGPGFPGVTLRTLSTYSGKKLRAYVWAPSSVAELEGMLAYARSSSRRVTFRTGGQSFDTQSLNDQMVISLERFTEVKVDEAARTATVGAGATWGAILKATLKQGLVPYVMVTNSIATAGGTLSANCLSRFSATIGREGAHVVELLLVTPDGKSRRCSRTDHPALFHAVIGGFGYVGAVLEITYRLLHVGRGAVVKTEFTRVEGLDKIRNALHDGDARATRFGAIVETLSRDTRASVARCEAAPPHAPATPEAVSAVVYLRGGAWGLVARSRYVAPTRLKPSIFHSPGSLRHLLLQLCATIPLLRRLGYLITFRLGYPGVTVNHDEPFGYTFFEDGNRRLRRLLKRLGVPCRILQQTYCLPSAGDSGVDSGALSAFLTEADAHLDQAGLEPALIDVLYIAADRDRFLLSSSNGFAGFAVTFTFEHLFGRLQKEAEALIELSRICERHQGRVHLVKNVHADSELIYEMYRPHIDQLKALRGTNQAGHVLNEFSERVLPRIS